VAADTSTITKYPTPLALGDTASLALRQSGVVPVWNPPITTGEASPYGFRAAKLDELGEVCAAAERIMGGALAPEAAVRAVEEHTRGTVHIHIEQPSKKNGVNIQAGNAPANPDGDGPTPAALGGEITGIVLLLPLNAAGEGAMRDGTFDTHEPRIEHTCAPGDYFCGMYVWLYAGKGMRARLNVMRCCIAWREGFFRNVRGYGRGATPEGAGAMLHLGFKSVPFGVPNLFIFDRADP
jgi:hypothetical protein